MFKKLIVPVILALSFLIVTILALPQGSPVAAAAMPDNQIEVTTVSVTGPLGIRPSETTVFTTEGYASGTDVEILIGGVRMARGQANGDGVFTSSIVIPRSLPQDDELVITGQTTDRSRSVTYTTVLSPDIFTNLDAGSVGTAMNVTGYGFAISETVVMTLTDLASTLVATSSESGCAEDLATVEEPLGTAVSSQRGSINTNVEIPDVEDGTYYIVAQGTTSGICAAVD